MRYIPEAQSSAIVTHEMAFEAISDAFRVAGAPHSVVFPALIAHGSDPRNRFSVKSGATEALAGLKMGFIWPGNTARGLPTHNSVTVLFNQDTGGVHAVIESGVVNAFRTAAADAVATNQLARQDARTLAVFGAGNQAGYDCMAIARIRKIETVLVVNADAARAERFAQRLAAHGLKVERASAQEACSRADIIVTATPSKAPLFEADWIRPGTHISCMGADGVGKQELPTGLYGRSQLFCDLAAQSVMIGEFQHAATLIQAGAVTLTQIGTVLSGQASGRRDDQAITIFDSSGIALQDLYIAERLLSACPLRG
jgi:ornithine cyclodeaminase